MVRVACRGCLVTCLPDVRSSSGAGAGARQMAKWLGAPVLLVVDCWAMGRSIAALIKGFEVRPSPPYV